MQIWTFEYMFEFIEKQHLKSYLTAQPEFFLKSSLPFSIFLYVCKQAGTYISKSKRCYNAKPSVYYFSLKTKMSVDFHISISVPLNQVWKCSTMFLLEHFMISPRRWKTLRFSSQKLSFVSLFLLKISGRKTNTQ